MYCIDGPAGSTNDAAAATNGAQVRENFKGFSQNWRILTIQGQIEMVQDRSSQARLVELEKTDYR
jgi:hypothetical protein